MQPIVQEIVQDLYDYSPELTFILWLIIIAFLGVIILISKHNA